MIPTTISQDRVREQSDPSVNEEMDQEFQDHIKLYQQGDPAIIDRRLAQLDREWDIERVLETNAATFALAGTLLGITRHRKWLALPTLVTSFLLMHALQGWCPPLPLLRKLGIRTCREIERERAALRSLRGDFADLTPVQS